MINFIDWSDKSQRTNLYRILHRGEESFEKYYEDVYEIIKQVRNQGDKAVFRYTYKFDKFHINEKNFYFNRDDFEKAYKSLDSHIKTLLNEAKNRIEKYHSSQKINSFFTYEDNGTVLGQKISPLNSVGLYVPGGKALYPSTVLMTGIPAKVAGVEHIYIASPVFDPGAAKIVLAAAHLIGAEKMYKIGGAQAVAALAYGTNLIKKVDKIVGPGNIYVTVAKKLLFGIIDIDMIAGPSEILIIADKTADTDYITYDLFSQAEHDELASSVLITDSKEIAEEVVSKISQYVKSVERSEILEKSIRNNGAVILTSSVDEAVEIANDIAPEHLELMTEEPFSIMPKIKNAGAIFLGKYSPEPVGDYMAGPNHVLPTGGTAKFFSPLGVYDFCKRSSIIAFSKENFDKLKEHVSMFAKLEGLYSHSKSIEIRDSK
jgi:histidinol dehydrogenase